jgi:PadR family transcriptional regulator, regulatory protein AphA
VRRTATTANALLGLLALRPSWSTWELTKQLRRNMRFFWPRVESRIYDEARTLVTRGLARDRRSYTGRRGRTTYTITAKGKRELQRWLATPPRASSLECEPLLRVFLGDLGTHEQLLVALEQVRADADAILDVGRTVAAEYLAGTAPFQDQVHVRSLVFDFLSSHALMLRAWAERAEATVTLWPGTSSEERIERAKSIIAEGLARYPEVTITPSLEEPRKA